MEEVKRPKTIKEVFKDYNSASFELNYATVVGINLYKNKSLLEVIIESRKLINIQDILDLEKYIEKRFQVQTAKISINYKLEEDVSREEISEKIAKEWPQIVEYISHRHPIAKAFLKTSTIIIQNNKIQVTLSLNGKEFLESNKFNELFSGIIQNVYGEKYSIEYTEKVEENIITKFKENLEKMQKETILKATAQNNMEHTKNQEANSTPKKQYSQYAGKNKDNNFKKNYGASSEKKQYEKNGRQKAK